MTGIKPSTHGIVVEHKESGRRYAVSDRNYNEKVHRKVRDLRPGETVRGYQPKTVQALGDDQASLGDEGYGARSTDAAETQAVSPQTGGKDTKTEGANPGTQEKEGK